MAAAAIMDFENLKNLTADTLRGVNVHHHGKFCQNQSSGCEEIAMFRFFKMAAAAMLSFQKFKFLTTGGLRSVIMCYNTKFRVDQSNQGRN